MERAREGRRRKRKYGRGAALQSSAGVVVLPPGLLLAVVPLPEVVCCLREALFPREPAWSQAVTNVGAWRIVTSDWVLLTGFLNDTFVLSLLQLSTLGCAVICPSFARFHCPGERATQFQS